jgi:hypothetical protein
MRLISRTFLTVLFLSALPAIAADQPTSMIKMVVRVMGPGIKPGSFPALPKTIYRAGPRYARIEDPPDARQQIHKLTIIAEPDAYSVNLIDKKGTHAREQGGSDEIHLPVVLPFDPKHELAGLDRLEFGDEVDFFDEAGATKEAGPTINGKPTDALRLRTPGGSALLLLRSSTHTPVRLSWDTKEGTYRYEYIDYKEVPFNPALFAKPAGVSYREMPPDTSARD